MFIWIDRLMPARWRKRKELAGEERARLWIDVADTNPALVAVVDVLEDKLEGNFVVAIDVERPQEQRLRAMERAGIAYEVLQQIDRERAEAKEWADKQARREK